MERYAKRIDRLYEVTSDPELYHDLRDEIHMDFIKDFSNRKYDVKTLREISKLILRELKDHKKVQIWYA